MDREILKKLVGECVGVQIDFNTKTNGPTWITGITKEGLETDWDACLIAEVGELMDSLPFKHWKDIDAKADIPNVKIELADIFAFAASKTASEVFTKYSSVHASHMDKDHPTFELVLDIILDAIDPKLTNQFARFENTTSKQHIIRGAKHLHSAIGSRNEELMYTTINFMVNAISELEVEEGNEPFTFTNLLELYLGKMVLNQFRQDNGYKDGTYMKIWDGEEDNVVMQKIIASDVGASEPHTANSIYFALEAYYKMCK